jgi:hypothetical protein
MTADGVLAAAIRSREAPTYGESAVAGRNNGAAAAVAYGSAVNEGGGERRRR